MEAYNITNLTILAKKDDFKKKLRYQWERLTEEDLANAAVNIWSIALKLQERYGYTRWQAEKALHNFLVYPRYNIHAE